MGAVFTGGMMIGFIIGAISMSEVRTAQWEQRIAERGFGQYCPVSGDWAWKGECK